MDDLIDVVRRAQQGDTSSFAVLVSRFQDMAVGMAEARLGDFHLAEDAAQEAFIGAYLNLHQLRDPAAFPGWLKRLVCTRCSRHRRLHRAVAAPSTADDLSNPGPDPAAELIAREDHERVREGVRRLPDREREALTLFYLGEASHAEMASFLQVPVSTVKFRLHAARRRLRDELGAVDEGALRSRVPARSVDLTARTLAILNRLNPYQLGRLIVGTRNEDFVAWLRSDRRICDCVLAALPGYLRAVVQERVLAKPGDGRAQQVQAQMADRAACLDASPPPSGVALVAEQAELARVLATDRLMDLRTDRLAWVFRVWAESARLAGIPSLEVWRQQTRDEFLVGGLELVLVGSEPGLIDQVMEAWRQTRTADQRTRGQLVEVLLDDLMADRTPLFTAVRLSRLHRPSGCLSVDGERATPARLRALLRRHAGVAVDTGALAEVLLTLAWVYRNRGLEGLARAAEAVQDPLTREALIARLEWGSGGPTADPAAPLRAARARHAAHVAAWDVRHAMAAAGCAALQRGTPPAQIEAQLLRLALPSGS